MTSTEEVGVRMGRTVPGETRLESVKWGERTAEDLAAATASNPLVMLPRGCTEQDAGHLPVDTDTYQVEWLTVEGARQAVEGFGPRVLPPPPSPSDSVSSNSRTGA